MLVRNILTWTFLTHVDATAVVLFPEENKYSLVPSSSIKEQDPKVGSFINVKEQGKTNYAKLIFVGNTSLL